METPLYFFWSSISLSLFYIFYLVVLKSETFFLLNRIYLLSALLLSMLIPLLDLSLLITLPKMELKIPTLYDMGGETSAFVVEKELNWLAVTYWIGVLFSATLLLIKLLGVKKKIRLTEKGSAFSFWKTKVIDEKLADFVAIDAHENVHIKQFHTLDILLTEVIAVFFWFHPLIYCYRRSLKYIHEYLADEQAANFAVNKKQYALILFLQNFKAGPTLTNSFYSPSLLEARIKMLQSKKSKPYRLWKYSLYIPMIALITVMCAFSPSDLSGSRNKVNQAANFPGGFGAFRKYLIEHVRNVSNVNGKVALSFTVETNGEVTNEQVMTSLNKVSDNEALEAIKSSPNWHPAFQNGEKVRVAHQIEINFTSDNQHNR